MLSQQVYQRKPISRLNVFLLLGLLGFSMLGAWSTSVAQEGAYGAFIKHVISMCLGLGAFVGISFSGYRLLQRWVVHMYGLLLFLLFLVLLIGFEMLPGKFSNPDNTATDDQQTAAKD